MVSDPLTDGWYVRTSNTRTYPMLIVCPNCSTSYTIEPGSLGSAGRSVRCARCKTTWFADASPAEVTALADGAIDESATHESPGVIRPDRGPDHAGVDMAPAQESAVAPDEPAPEPAESPAPMPAAIADAPSLVAGDRTGVLRSRCGIGVRRNRKFHRAPQTAAGPA